MQGHRRLWVDGEVVAEATDGVTARALAATLGRGFRAVLPVRHGAVCFLDAARKEAFDTLALFGVSPERELTALEQWLVPRASHVGRGSAEILCGLSGPVSVVDAPDDSVVALAALTRDAVAGVPGHPLPVVIAPWAWDDMSPLSGRSMISGVERGRASRYAASRRCADVLWSTRAGLAVQFGSGSLLWHVADELRTPAASCGRTWNPVAERLAARLDAVHVEAAPTDLDSAQVVLRVTSSGDLHALGSLEDTPMEVSPALLASARDHLVDVLVPASRGSIRRPE